MDLHAERPSVQVPERLLHATQRRRLDAPAGHAGHRSLGEVAPDRLHGGRVTPDQLRSQAMTDEEGQGGVVPALRRLAQPDEAIVGLHADEDPVAAVVDPHAEDADIDDLHAASSAPGPANAAAAESAPPSLAFGVPEPL